MKNAKNGEEGLDLGQYLVMVMVYTQLCFYSCVKA